MRRIWIKGTSGAGKSTLGRALAQRLGVPYIELDALHHGPRWQAATAPELQARLARLLEDPRGWVVDGNYDDKLGALALADAELVVWLDLPLTTKLTRLLKRSVQRQLNKEVLWNGNRETLRDAFWGLDALFPWAVRSHFAQRRAWPARFKDRNCIRLRTAQEVDEWMGKFG